MTTTATPFSSTAVRVVAVDAVGSVTFGGPQGRRIVPGLGTSVRPALLDESYVDDVVLVEEADAIRACHRLARRGFLFGGSSGTVISGALRWLAEREGQDLTAVAIAPDFGERYLDTIYCPDWLNEHFPDDVLNPHTRRRSAASMSAAQRFLRDPLEHQVIPPPTRIHGPTELTNYAKIATTWGRSAGRRPAGCIGR
jgi:hypothetical protein